MSLEHFGSHIWFNGRRVPSAEATVSVMAHALHYGSAVFEGLRAYETPQGSSIFCLEKHIQRLFFSASIYRMQIPYTPQQIAAACCEMVRHGGHRSVYIRPVVFRGQGFLGVVPKDTPTEVAIAVMPWGTYLGAAALEQGVRVCIASWQRLAPNTMPTMAKAAGNYLSSQLIAMEAKRHGYDEAIALNTQGLVSEGPGENIFLVQNGRLLTPPLSASILPGITRETILSLARHSNIPVEEQPISREALYSADELFFTGTAVEVTPINSVDDIAIGSGLRGPITHKLQDLFFGIFKHTTPAQPGWLTPVAPPATCS